MLVVYAAWIKNTSEFKTVGGLDHYSSLVRSGTNYRGKSVHASFFFEDIL